MNPPSPVVAAHPPSRRARWHGVLALLARSPAFLLFPARHRLARPDPERQHEAGAAKLAAYAFIAGGIRPS